MLCPNCKTALKDNYCKKCNHYVENREVSSENVIISTGRIEHINSSPFDGFFGGGVFGGLSQIINELVFGFDIHEDTYNDPFEYVELIDSSEIIEISEIEKFDEED